MAVLAGGGSAPGAEPGASGAGRFAAVSHPDVQVTSIGRTRDAHGLLLRLRSFAGEALTAEVTVPGAVSAMASSPAAPGRRQLAMRDGTIGVPVPACGTAEVAVSFGPALPVHR